MVLKGNVKRDVLDLMKGVGSRKQTGVRAWIITLDKKNSPCYTSFLGKKGKGSEETTWGETQHGLGER